MSEHKFFPCIEVRQPIGPFYLTKIDVVDILKIAYADIRRIETETDNILGIQRELSPKRVKEIAKYVKTKDATFPTNVILSIRSERIKSLDNVEEMQSDELEIISYKDNVLKIIIEENVAKIIDGYHRIAGLASHSDWNVGEFEINVTVFIDMDPEDEAIVFATINKAQTKPSNSLAYDLFELAKSRSPQKTAHNIVRFFNKQNENPFYRKIKLLGKSIYGTETISQATFVESVMAFISTDPMLDRDLLKRNKELPLNNKDLENLIFRRLFIEEKDAVIAKIINNYFEAIRMRWPDAWNAKVPEMILNRTTGFIALMRFLKIAYSLSSKDGNQIVSIEDFYNIFIGIPIEEKNLNKDIYKPGGSGIAQLYKDLKNSLNT